jgi:uncharacterized OsmC-like protein
MSTIFKTWTITAVSVGEEPLQLLCDDRPLRQSQPGTLDDVSPVQHLLLAVAGCFALSCRAVLQRRTAPLPRFEVHVSGHKLRGGGNRLSHIAVTAVFPTLSEAEARITAHEAEALCTVTSTLSGSPALSFTVRSDQAVDPDVERVLSRG